MENSTKDIIRNFRKKYSYEVYNTLLPEYKEDTLANFNTKYYNL